MARQLTFAAMALAVSVGAWKISSSSATEVGQYFIPVAVLVAGLWASFRLINLPRFADFLISVEAEMNKVSWPARSELWRASTVVIVVIFFLAATLYAYDIVLRFVMGQVFGL